MTLAKTAVSWRPVGWRAALAAAIALPVAFAVHLLLPYFRDGHLDDLEVYRQAIRLLSPSNSRLYAYRSPIGDTFNYPPFAALVLWPVAHVPSWVAASLITALTIVAFTATVIGVSRRTFTLTASIAAVIAAIGLVSSPLQSDLRFGQVSVLVTLIVCADLYLDWRAARFAGVLLGLACAIKLTPLVIVALLFVAGRRRTALISMAAFFTVTAMTWVVLPTPSTTYWTKHAWQSSDIPGVWGPANQSILGCLHRLGLAGRPASLMWVGAAVLVFLVGARTTSILYRQRAVVSAAGVMGAVSLLVSPISWTHHQAWLLFFPALLLEHRRPLGRRGAILGVGAVAVTWFNMGAVVQFLPGLHFIGENVRVLLSLTVVVLGADIHRVALVASSAVRSTNARRLEVGAKTPT